MPWAINALLLGRKTIRLCDGVRYSRRLEHQGRCYLRKGCQVVPGEDGEQSGKQREHSLQVARANSDGGVYIV